MSPARPHDAVTLLAAALLVAGLAVSRADALAACHSTCTEQLAECKRTCPGGGPARRDCRAACAARSTCTAPGARIRTLAYVVNECSTSPDGLSTLKQQLFVRRGNCDPVMVMEAATPDPVPDPQKWCDSVGGRRDGESFRQVGVFHRMAVLPNGSAVVFEVTKQFSAYPPLTPEPPAEGIFVVRADGTDLRRLGDASRYSSRFGPYFGQGFFPVSPDGRWLALSDLGEYSPGHEAPQIFLLDPRSGKRKRKQITYQSRQPILFDAVIEFIGFLNAKTIIFYNGFPTFGTARGHRVHTDGRGVIEDIATPTV